MNGIHDMGGMQDMGPIRIEKNEPVFHASWERRMFALFNAVDLPWPVLRAQIDSIPPADYLRISYYEKWLTALPPLLTKSGMATKTEIDSGKASGGRNQTWHVLSSAEVATWNIPESDAKPKPGAPPRFRVGQQVRARNMNPETHTRLPRYVRGKPGTVTRDNGVDVFPDTSSQGLGDKPQHVYCVRFMARELWGEQASAVDSVYVDLWDDYLEPA